MGLEQFTPEQLAYVQEVLQAVQARGIPTAPPAATFDDGVSQAVIVDAAPMWTGCMACNWGPVSIDEWDAHAATSEHARLSNRWAQEHSDDRYYTFNDDQGLEVRRA